MNRNNWRPNAGDFVLSDLSKQWLDQHKNRLARLRSNPRLVAGYYKAMDDLYKFAFEVKIYHKYPSTHIIYVAT